MSFAEKQSKVERLEVRLTPTHKSLLAQAAQLHGTTLSDFILSSAIAAAENTVTMPRVSYAGEEGWAALHRLFDDDAAYEPSPEAIARLTRLHRTWPT